MKRTPMPPRTARLTRSAPLAPINVERTEKRARKRKADWRSAHNRAVRAEAFARAGHRCEYLVPSFVPERFGPTRCPETARLEAHHLRYPRTRPLRASDLMVVCRVHHRALEMTQYSYRHARRPGGARGGGGIMRTNR